jgi:hypothetical protein
MRFADKRTLLFWTLPVAAFTLALCATSGARPATTPSPVQGSLSAPPVETPRLDPTLHDALLRALNPEPVSFPESPSNPFLDRTGVMREANATPPSDSPRLSEASHPVTPAQTGRDSQPQPTPRSVPPLAERGRAWQQRVRDAHTSGAVPPSITTVYSLDELEAVGRGSGGAAWILIKPEERSFTARPGSRFYDAVLIGVNDQGVTFRTDEGRTHTLPFTRADR